MVPKLTARLTLITPIQHPSNRRIAHLLLRISTSTVTRIVSNRSYRRGPKHCDKENKSPRIPTFVYLQDEGKKEPFFGSYLYLLGVYRSYVFCISDRETPKQMDVSLIERIQPETWANTNQPTFIGEG